MQAKSEMAELPVEQAAPAPVAHAEDAPLARPGETPVITEDDSAKPEARPTTERAIAVALALPIVADPAEGEAVLEEAPLPASPPRAPILTTRPAVQREEMPAPRQQPAADGKPAIRPTPAEPAMPVVRMASRDAGAEPSMERRDLPAQPAPATPRPVATREFEPLLRPVAAPAPAPAEAAAPQVTAGPVSAQGEAGVASLSFARPAGMDAMQDLSRIVDRLAAAREALAPATAALAINHAEFGEISLRFDQRQDGRLTAEIAGADAETHRVIAQALGAERGQNAGADTQSQASQQQQQGGQALRGSLAEREAGGGQQGDGRQDQARQRSARAAADHNQPGSGQTHDGVFA